jgi:hypothetical protein
MQAGKTVEATLPANLNWNVSERDWPLRAGNERRYFGRRHRSNDAFRALEIVEANAF